MIFLRLHKNKVFQFLPKTGKGQCMTFLEELEHHPSIHKTGSVKGMKKCGYWDKDDVVVRYGDYFYNFSIWIA